MESKNENICTSSISSKTVLDDNLNKHRKINIEQFYRKQNQNIEQLSKRLQSKFMDEKLTLEQQIEPKQKLKLK